MEAKVTIAERFSDLVFDWDYETYLALGGYGSGKSHHIGIKIILKCLEQKRKVLVVREVYGTLKESCFDLLHEILVNMNLVADESKKGDIDCRVKVRNAPMQFIFPNGSRIIFKGMDEPQKIKSLHGVSIVWLEECSEIKYAGYKELLGRLRTKGLSNHFILSCNPVGRENWVYRHFFRPLDDEGNETVILDDERLYEKGTLVKNAIYYHHSVPDDNPFLPYAYIKRLDDLSKYDYPLYRVARFGRFGPSGTRVLPQIKIASSADKFKKEIDALGKENHFYGMDFGFEESYNAVLSMAVDSKNSILYIYDEIYMNKVTDDKFAVHPKMLMLKERLKEQNKMLVADNEDPKAITYYRQNGFNIRGCRNKFAGSRLSNTRKVKRFKRIVISPKCKNTIRELKELTYKKDAKGNVIYDDFNIDPHTFSAIWYGLDSVTVANVKERKFNSKSGEKRVS